MKRVLVITYYWPPNGGAGVYRWLKFCKYLPEHGWTPVVYTPSNPELTAEDPGLLRDVLPGTEVLRRPIREPFALYKRFTGRARGEKLQTAFLSEEHRGGWRERLALWVRANFFIPDARIGWVLPSVRFLSTYLREHPVDAIVTTGPPHSMHLIGLGLKRALGIPWLADFRDPWTDIDYFGELPLTRRALVRHQRLEREVLTHADQVVTVSWSWARDLDALGAKNTEVVTNGYDPGDIPSPAEPVDERWSLVHVGSLSATRDCPALWRLLAELRARDPEFGERFTLRFVGPVDQAILSSVRDAGLADRLDRVGRVPHDEAMRAMQRARVLLLPINETPNQAGILPGKLFEYLAAGRPILAVGPPSGDVARVLGEGHLLMPRDEAAADHERVLELFRRGGMAHGTAHGVYARPALAARIARLLEDLVRGA